MRLLHDSNIGNLIIIILCGVYISAILSRDYKRWKQEKLTNKKTN